MSNIQERVLLVALDRSPRLVYSVVGSCRCIWVRLSGFLNRNYIRSTYLYIVFQILGN